MAVFEQERHVELVSGAAEAFVITNRMVSASIPSELPHVNVFVVNVVVPSDPTQDTLARVAAIADLSSIPIGRDAGIAAPGVDGIQWLSASWTARYSTLETGLDAAQAFRDRVNALITDWQNFRTNFNAPDPTPAFYTFPATDTSQLTTLVAAYKAAKQDRYNKQLAKTAADAAVTAAQNDLTYKQGVATAALALVASAGNVSSEMSNLRGFLSTLQSASNTYYSNNNALGGIVGNAAFLAAINLAATQLTQATTYVSDAAGLSTAVTLFQTNRQADVASASTILSTVTATQISSGQALTSAQTLEAATLAAVIAICPNFDSHSIPLVDG